MIGKALALAPVPRKATDASPAIQRERYGRFERITL